MSWQDDYKKRIERVEPPQDLENRVLSEYREREQASSWKAKRTPSLRRKVVLATTACALGIVLVTIGVNVIVQPESLSSRTTANNNYSIIDSDVPSSHFSLADPAAFDGKNILVSQLDLVETKRITLDGIDFIVGTFSFDFSWDGNDVSSVRFSTANEALKLKSVESNDLPSDNLEIDQNETRGFFVVTAQIGSSDDEANTLRLALSGSVLQVDATFLSGKQDHLSLEFV